MKIQITIVSLCLYVFSSGQTSSLSLTNTPSNPSDYLGWDLGVSTPLVIAHLGSEDIDISVSGGDGIYIENSGSIGIGDFDGTTIPTIANLSANRGSSVNKPVAAATLFMDSQNEPLQALGAQFQLVNSDPFNYSILSSVGLSQPDRQVAIYGEVCNPDKPGIAIFGEAPIGMNNWAGYFNGQIAHSTMVFGPSDQNLKINIEDMVGMNEMLADIQVVTYNFSSDPSIHLNLPSGNQIGVLAQNVYEVFPELTKTVGVPTPPESEEDYSDEEYLGVRYGEFIPMLIAAYQERTQLINNQQFRIEEIQSQIDELNLLLEEM